MPTASAVSPAACSGGNNRIALGVTLARTSSSRSSGGHSQMVPPRSKIAAFSLLTCVSIPLLRFTWVLLRGHLIITFVILCHGDGAALWPIAARNAVGRKSTFAGFAGYRQFERRGAFDKAVGGRARARGAGVGALSTRAWAGCAGLRRPSTPRSAGCRRDP